MKLTLTSLLALLFACFQSHANMSSPYSDGTKSGSAFASKDIDILSETIGINISEDFKTARFTVEYTIRSEAVGTQIPLLFYAQDFNDDFSVWLDDQSVAIQDIPEKYTDVDDSPFSNFSGIFSPYNSPTQNDLVTIRWSKNSSYSYHLHDLKYFETNIGKGTHKIRVSYNAKPWIDYSGWVKEYSFRYSLSPARFWKTFGTLQVNVQQEGQAKQVVTNLPSPVDTLFPQTTSWHFTSLPADFLAFTYTPKPGKLAAILIAIDPVGISIIVGILLVALHVFLIRRYRRKGPVRKYSPVVAVGSLVVPLLFLLSYPYSFQLIDNIIGDEAARHHGYSFLSVFCYPVLLPLYWSGMWLLDRFYRRRMAKI